VKNSVRDYVGLSMSIQYYNIGIFDGYIYGHDEGGCNNHIALYNGDVVEVSVTTHCWDDFCALDI
jgi:hypothetical protein